MKLIPFILSLEHFIKKSYRKLELMIQDLDTSEDNISLTVSTCHD